MPIGVFDSGLGGLTVLGALQNALPGQAFVYLGDHAHAPYGARSAPEILDLTMAACGLLFARGCDLVILACNTASSVALKPMQEYFVTADKRVLGVFVPVIEVLAGRAWADRAAPTIAPVNDVLFFATPATVRSGAFSREVALRTSNVRIVEVPCPGLVDALETDAQADAARIVRTCTAQGLAQMPTPEVTVLGCTHYPLMQTQFAAALPPGTRTLSQPRAVADALCDYLARHPRFAGGGGQTYLTTGHAGPVTRAALALTGRDLVFRTV